ncbi:hypothetical protein BCR32DRAFT_329069 [Anaeromyces robustus]|uniref:Protein BCP1 n=1 Tax=Anaeromyces robustus TaxID=1754192 RepID=A0A1Y1WU89_9FUNG|nr:hypothetical protein BCR32DRAFT_329069 [Anaeromyces robustus]|eukprot:ORX77083.1 hypothetical protein BCR32DRAFT_329069 [Anaeromyces robustus]
MTGEKRKAEEIIEKKDNKNKKKEEAFDSDSDSENEDEEINEIIDVDFEFFDPQPQDFYGYKILLKQIFGNDHEYINLSDLADLVLSQPLLGSSVKVQSEDPKKEDPYAMLSVLNMQEHKDKVSIQQIKKYLNDRLTKKSVSLKKLNGYLNDESKPVGLLLNERLINMPPQVVPPMFRMLLEEIQWAIEDKEPYEFAYYMVLSKLYRMVESKVDKDENAPQTSVKKNKKSKINPEDLNKVFYFQPEDEIIEKYSVLKIDFRMAKSTNTDSKRTFYDYGIDPFRRVLIFPADKLQIITDEISELLKEPENNKNNDKNNK